MKAIYKFKLRGYDSDTIEGKFVEDTEIMQELIKRNPKVFIDEPWGKHSCLYEPISEFCVELVSDKQGDVKLFIDLDLRSGGKFIDSLIDSEPYKEVEEYISNKR